MGFVKFYARLITAMIGFQRTTEFYVFIVIPNKQFLSHFTRDSSKKKRVAGVAIEIAYYAAADNNT